LEREEASKGKRKELNMEIVNKRDKDRDENGSYKVMYLLA
jgi:hypothetical protein